MLNSKLTHHTHHTLQVRFEGLPYLQEDLVGEYILQCEKINGYPVYVMARPKTSGLVTTPAVLCRSHGGFWMVGSPEDVAEEKGWLFTASDHNFELPSKAGLTWRYIDPAKPAGSRWTDSDTIICSES
jgi:hypothetical protein